MMESVHSDLRANRLFALLDDASLQALAGRVERVELTQRMVLYEEGQPMTHAWFPAIGVLSMLASAQAAQTRIEVATIGREGAAAIPLLLGGQRSLGNLFPQVTGWGWRMAADDFLQAVGALPAFSRVMHRYAHALLMQIAQGTACNRAHDAEQRCARWLLQTHDRVDGDTFDLTQEFLAEMLGERRATVNQVASQLQQRGFISYTRGHIEIVNRAGLEDVSCRCYRLIREEYEQVVAP